MLKTPPRIAFISFFCVRFEKLIVVQLSILVQVVLLDCLNFFMSKLHEWTPWLLEFLQDSSANLSIDNCVEFWQYLINILLTESTSFIESFFFASFSSPWWKNEYNQKRHKGVCGLCPEYPQPSISFPEIPANTHSAKNWSKCHLCDVTILVPVHRSEARLTVI